MRGKQITSIGEIMELARHGRAVIVDQGTRDWRTPAAFLQNFQANRLYPLVEQGRVYEYEKPILQPNE